MGVVYEAVHEPDARRVALKVLAQGLESEVNRQRFLREGRLAASLSHPHSIYIYGTDEIDSRLVISMELAEGGTLADRLAAEGPLPVPAAVDATLQALEGLEAAHSIGVLHRDLKPSNCFVTADGTVKVGDYGLSIPTDERADSRLTEVGLVVATPAYAPPEQLTGDRLDERTDVYAVGVMLYELLTASLPYSATSPVQLIATVLGQPPRPIADLRPEVPAGLARIIEKCLAKRPEDRYASCGELRAALARFAAPAQPPAGLVLRAVAALIDGVIQGAILWGAAALSTGLDQLVAPGSPFARYWGGVLGVAYFGLLEGLWGTTPGKFAFGMRVRRVDGEAAGLGRGFARSFLFALPLLPFALLPLDASEQATSVAGVFWLLRLALFVTARRRNGWAAMHDLATRTRVVLAGRVDVGRRAITQRREVEPARTGERTGAFLLQGAAPGDDSGTWFLAHDERLGRQAWIRRLAATDTPTPEALRALHRSGRVRWLAGGTDDRGPWEGFEAPSGAPFLRVGAQPRTWKRVRLWLLDLARELSRATTDGTLPAALGLDRLWVTDDDQLVLLSFPAPGAAAGPRAGAADLSPTGLLAAVARYGLDGDDPAAGHDPLPLHATATLRVIEEASDLQTIVGRLESILLEPAAVSRRRRLGMLGVVGGPAIVLAVMGTVILAVVRGLMAANPELAAAREWTEYYLTLDSDSAVPVISDSGATGDSGVALPPSGRSLREEVAIYIGSRFGAIVEDSAAWNSAAAIALIQDPERSALASLVRERGAADATSIQQAERVVATLPPATAPDPGRLPNPVTVLGIVLGLMLSVSGAVSLGAGLVARRGFVQRLFGVHPVTRDGAPAGRLRILARNGIAWAPVLMPFLLQTLDVIDLNAWWWVAMGILFAIGLGIAIKDPARGLHDRLAGTWLVPR